MTGGTTHDKAEQKHDLEERRLDSALTTHGYRSGVGQRDLCSPDGAAGRRVFALYVKTKNFHWHMSGPHFRDYHLLLDDHGDQLFAMTDNIAERVRKIGGTTLRSIGHIDRIKRISDNDADYVTPADMLSELWEDNKSLTLSMRSLHDLCDDAGDVATTSVLENWIDETQRRAWFLYEISRD